MIHIFIRNLLFLFVINICQVCSAQTLINREFHYNEENDCLNVQRLKNGNYAIGGLIGYVDYSDPHNAQDFIGKTIIVLDSAGNVLWRDEEDYDCFCYYLNVSGNVTVLLNENSDSSIFLVSQFDPLNVASIGIIKYSSIGDSLWYKASPDTAGFFDAQLVMSDSSNGLFIAGLHLGSNWPWNIFFARIDSGGNFLFRNNYNLPYTNNSLMEYDFNGNIRIFSSDEQVSSFGHILTFDNNGNFLSDDSIPFTFNNVIRSRNGDYLFSHYSEIIKTDSNFNVIRLENFSYRIKHFSEAPNGNIIISSFLPQVSSDLTTINILDSLFHPLWSVQKNITEQVFGLKDSLIYFVGMLYGINGNGFFTLLNPQDCQLIHNPTIVCQDDSIEVTAPLGFSNYQWSNGDTGNPVFVNQTGNYFASFEDTSEVRWYTSSDSIIFFLSPDVLNGTDTTLCINQSITFNAGSSFNSQVWQDGSTDTTFTISSPSVISFPVSILINDTNGCTTKDSIEVIFDLCNKINESSFQNEIEIYPNPTQDFIYVTISENYALTLIDASGRILINRKIIKGLNILDVRNFPVGIYAIRFVSDTKTINRKIILAN